MKTSTLLTTVLIGISSLVGSAVLAQSPSPDDAPRLGVYETTLPCGGEPISVSTADLPAGAAVIVLLRDGATITYSRDGEELARIQRPRTARTDGLAPTQAVPGSDVALDTHGHRLLIGAADAPTEVGAFGARPGLFNRPRGLAVHGDRIFVADTGNHRIQALASDGTYRHQIGLHQLVPREGEGSLHYPTSVAVSPAGDRLFVAEPLEGRVQVFRARRPNDPPPNPALSWERADLPSHFGEHWDVHGPWLIVSEPDAERVSLFRIREGGEPIRVSEIGGVSGSRLGQFKNPGAVRFLSGEVVPGAPVRAVIADRGNRRVQLIEILPQEGPERFDPRLIRVVRARTTSEPLISLTVERSGRVLVASRDSVKALRPDLSPDPERGPTRTFTAREVYWAEQSASLLIIEDSIEGARIREVAPNVKTPGRRWDVDAGGVAQLSDGTVVFTDAVGHRLCLIDPRGALRTIGGPGVGPLEFHHPRAAAIDREDRIWVLDHGNHRGQVIDREGNLLWAFGSRAFTAPIRAALRQAARESGGEGEQ